MVIYKMVSVKMVPFFLSFFFICPFILSFVCPSGFCLDGFFQLDHYAFEKNGMLSETHMNFYFFYPQNGAKWAENRFLEVTEKVGINVF